MSALDFNKTYLSINEGVPKGSLAFWFRRSDFYITGLNYVCARVALTCQLTTIPYYITMVCGVKEIEDSTPYQVAIAPACSFIASFLYSIFVMDRLQKYHQHSKYNLFLYSICFFTIAGIPLYLMQVNEWTETVLYASLMLQGAGLANLMNTSTSLVSEMIGQDD